MAPYSLASRNQNSMFDVTFRITSNTLPGTTVSKFDGVAEIWFDDIAGAKAFFGSDGYRQNVIPDEQAFMDRKRCELLYTHEHSVMA
jgi:hypothetical protein